MEILSKAMVATATATASTGGVDLQKILKIISGGVGVVGGFMIVFGLIHLGMALKDSDHGGGQAIGSAIGWMIGGVVVCAAAIYFTTLDMSWVSA